MPASNHNQVLYPPVDPKNNQVPTDSIQAEKKKKKKAPTFSSRVNLGYDCVDIFPSPPTVNFLFFTINYRPSSHCFRFPLESWELEQLPLTIPNSYYRKNKSQKQKVLPTTSPMYKANGKQIQKKKKKNTYNFSHTVKKRKKRKERRSKTLLVYK